MTAPRRNSGPGAPGRIAAVMLRALAAELSDPGRYARAKAYARDDAVTDIDIAPGAVRAVVQGTRRDPYVATVHVDAHDALDGALGGALDDELDDGASGPSAAVSTALLIPSRGDVAATCTCPDGAAGARVVCKHALAALLVFADEVALEPDLLRRWRAPDDAGHRVRRRPVAPVDVLADRLRARGPLPTLGELDPVPTRPAPHDEVAGLLAVTRALLMAPANRR